jgi:ribosomal protein S18 acetylase RimI-like enzyme
LDIRRATPADAEVLCRIHLESRAAAMPWLAVVHTPEETLAYFHDVVLRQLEVWAAEVDGSVVGFAAVSTRFLDHLYVAPTAQGRGIGTGLLKTAKERRPGGLRLYVFQRNVPARRFYERNGFRLIHSTDGTANEEREPDAQYEWP